MFVHIRKYDRVRDSQALSNQAWCFRSPSRLLLSTIQFNFNWQANFRYQVHLQVSHWQLHAFLVPRQPKHFLRRQRRLCGRQWWSLVEMDWQEAAQGIHHRNCEQGKRMRTERQSGNFYQGEKIPRLDLWECRIRVMSERNINIKYFIGYMYQLQYIKSVGTIKFTNNVCVDLTYVLCSIWDPFNIWTCMFF